MKVTLHREEIKNIFEILRQYEVDALDRIEISDFCFKPVLRIGKTFFVGQKIKRKIKKNED